MKRKRSQSNSNLNIQIAASNQQSGPPPQQYKVSGLNNEDIMSNMIGGGLSSSPNLPNLPILLSSNNVFVRSSQKRKNTDRTARSTYKRKSTKRTIDSRMNNNLGTTIGMNGPATAAAINGAPTERRKVKRMTAVKREN